MADCESSDTIGFDEYLEHGIPDALLQGLGFYTSSDDAAGTTSEPTTVAEESSETTADYSLFTPTFSVPAGLPNVIPTPRRRGRPPKLPRYSEPPAAVSVTTVSVTPAHTRTTNSLPFSSSAPGHLAAKTIVKGNIIYKRTETGEVIASVIKNGVNSDSSATSGGSMSRGRPPSYARSTASLCRSGETSLPADCPVDENNVERILDETITATQSMRRVLTSLKDDLRRMGGGAAMAPTLKPIHLQHRIDIAYKLARAFADYRSTISAVSSAELPLSAASTITPSVSSVPVSSSQNIQMTVISPSTMAVNNSLSLTSSSEHSVAAVKPVAPEKPVRETAARMSGELNVVSDDLWMSCEPDQE